MIRANRENREWENEAWDKQEDKAGERRIRYSSSYLKGSDSEA